MVARMARVRRERSWNFGIKTLYRRKRVYENFSQVRNTVDVIDRAPGNLTTAFRALYPAVVNPRMKKPKSPPSSSQMYLTSLGVGGLRNFGLQSSMKPSHSELFNDLTWRSRALNTASFSEPGTGCSFGVTARLRSSIVRAKSPRSRSGDIARYNHGREPLCRLISSYVATVSARLWEVIAAIARDGWQCVTDAIFARRINYSPSSALTICSPSRFQKS